VAWGEWIDRMQYWGYRAASYLAINYLEDPAWLAFALC